MEYKTGSLALAAFLVARGAHILRCEINGTTRCDFVLADTNNNLNQIASTYHTTGTAPARVFYKSLLDLKKLAKQTVDGGAR